MTDFLYRAFLIIVLNIIFFLTHRTNKYIVRRIKRCFQTNQEATFRQNIDEFIKRLEIENTDELNDNERIGRVVYLRIFSERSRKRDKSLTNEEPVLPVFLEQCVQLYNNRVLYNMTLFVLFFFFSIIVLNYVPLSMNPVVLLDNTTTSIEDGTTLIQIVNKYFHWFGFLESEEEEEEESRQNTISRLMNRNTYPCRSYKPSQDEFCFLEEEDVKQANFKLKLPQLDKEINSNESIYYLIDKWGSIYFYPGEPNQIDFLVNTLESIRLDEEEKRNLHGYMCICPAFLGIRQNISFFYNTNEERWIIMLYPVIIRENILAGRVSSTVRYHYNSNLFSVNEDLHRRYNNNDDSVDAIDSGNKHPLIDLEHSSSFVVEYEDLPDQSSVSDLLKEMDNKMISVNPRPLILERVTRFEKKRQQMIGDQAICFIYCNKVSSIIH